MIIVSFLKPQLCDSAPRFLFRDHGVGSLHGKASKLERY